MRPQDTECVVFVFVNGSVSQRLTRGQITHPVDDTACIFAQRSRTVRADNEQEAIASSIERSIPRTNGPGRISRDELPDALVEGRSELGGLPLLKVETVLCLDEVMAAVGKPDQKIIGLFTCLGTDEGDVCADRRLRKSRNGIFRQHVRGVPRTDARFEPRSSRARGATGTRLPSNHRSCYHAESRTRRRYESLPSARAVTLPR